MDLITTMPEAKSLSPKLVELVQQFKLYAKQSAKSTVKLGATLIEAETKLSPDEFKLFCSEVGLEKDGSTFRKLRQIGKKAARFQPHLDEVYSAIRSLNQMGSPALLV
jgi:hypothetical protein